uniref:Bursicon n=1 Tax=Panagrolaimus superbus TaxID=310955 RepID=A0A914XXW9_9BILA
MRRRLSLFVLPIIVLHLFILVTLTYSRPSKISLFQSNYYYNNNKNNNKNIDWTSVERVSRSLTSNEMKDQQQKEEKEEKHRIAIVSKEIFEEDDNEVVIEEDRKKEYVDVETNLSQAAIKEYGKITFDSLRPSNDLPEVVIDPPLKTDQMRYNEWQQRPHHKKKEHQKAPEWFNNRKNDTEVHGCVASPFSQRIHIAGCETKYILNRYCHGACASIYIPEIRSKKLKAVFSNCLVCRPAEVEHIQVRLECPNGSLVRDVMRVKRCECQEIDAPLPS